MVKTTDDNITVEGGEPEAYTLTPTPGATPTIAQIPGGVPDLEVRLRPLFPVGPEGLRLRLNASYYDPELRSYLSWNDVRWAVDIHSIEQAQRLREGLDEFLRLWVEQEASRG